MRICVFGASSPKIDESYITAVENLCELLAKRGHELIFGAGKNGLMGAAARGFKKGGERITGVIPNFFREDRIEHIYEHCDELIYTESMRERKQIMEDYADSFIITPGGIGTFEEFYEVLTLKQLGRHNKPIVIYNINGFYDELMKAMKNAVDKGFITEECESLYSCKSGEEEVIRSVEEISAPKFSLSELKEG